MSKVIEQLNAGKYTVLCLDSSIPLKKFNKIEIEGVLYTTEIVYDLPQSIGVLGTGNFVGKTVTFC